MDYRRYYRQGGCYFFTVNLANRQATTLVDHIDLLRVAYQRGLCGRPVKTLAMVVLPDHLHVIWQLPPNDADFSQRWRQIKMRFSRGLPKQEVIGKSRLHKAERGIWQRRFWEHVIRDENDLYRHVEYIHNNPVKHGYVQNAVDWPYSTIHRNTPITRS